MAQSFNITTELALMANAASATACDKILTSFASYSPALARSELGRLELIITLWAEDVWQATTTAQHLLHQLDIDITKVAVETSEDFDRRTDHTPVPPLVGVTEAAKILGVTRTAVLNRIERGTIPAQKVGSSSWVIPANALHT